MNVPRLRSGSTWMFDAKLSRCSLVGNVYSGGGVEGGGAPGAGAPGGGAPGAGEGGGLSVGALLAVVSFDALSDGVSLVALSAVVSGVLPKAV